MSPATHGRTKLGVTTRWALAAFLLLASPCPAAAPAAGPPVSALCLGQDASVSHTALPEKLRRDHGIHLGGVGFGELTWDVLKQYHVVILFDLSRLRPDTTRADAIEIGPQPFERVTDLLRRFIDEGGGVYMYGVSFNHMGQGWPLDTLNRFLEPYGGRVLFEALRDEPRERRQAGGMEVLYARADTITRHPATEGVRDLWYAAGPFSYGPWTRPLRLGPEWTPLVRTSPAFRATPIDPDKGFETPLAGAASQVVGDRAVIAAAREAGKGRIVLTGGESTISFFGYGHSEYADRAWGRIGMEAGLDGVPSDGLTLLASSLRWLAEPSRRAGNLGGFVAPPREPCKPKVADPRAWPDPEQIGEEWQYRKGLIGAMPANGGGSGTVAQFVEPARERGLGWVVFVADFARVDRARWDALVAECAAATTADFACVPAVLTRDEQDNRFIQCGAAAWPLPSRLSPADPTRVRDHLSYWMNDCNFAARIALLFGEGKTPAWLTSAYDSYALRTYRDSVLADDAGGEPFLFNQMQGDRARPVVVDLLSGPQHVAGVTEFTRLRGADGAQVVQRLTQPHFDGLDAYVSTGPVVDAWRMENGTRLTHGQRYTAGTERWRAYLRVTSPSPAVPLKSATIYDGTRPVRRFALAGETATVALDGLHDRRHVLTAVVEDAAGGRAVTGPVETVDFLMYQYFCGDRCNIMSGLSVIRHPDGRDEQVNATCNLYRAGRLHFCTVARAETLPGIDGTGGMTQFSVYANLLLNASEPERSELRDPVHQIVRPYESADVVVFDTPVLRRAAQPGLEIYGHAPPVPLAEPRVGGRLVQYHFHRNPVYPSPVMAEMSVTVTDPQGVRLTPGEHGLSLRYSSSWSTEIRRYAVIRGGGTRPDVEGPAADEGAGTRWQSTLRPGDCLLLPDVEEGMFVLEGDLDVVVECVPSRKWFRLYTGRADGATLPVGTTSSVRVLNLKTQTGWTGDALRGNWVSFRDAYGIGGKPPAYVVSPERGAVHSSRYLLHLQTDGGAFQGTVRGLSALPQRLPVQITGLNERWTAAAVDLDGRRWFPLGVWQKSAFTTLDPRDGDQRLFIGNLVTTEHPELWLTLLPGNAEGSTRVDVHNSTDKPVTATVRVPVTTFLAAAQEQPVNVPAGGTVGVKLRRE